MESSQPRSLLLRSSAIVPFAVALGLCGDAPSAKAWSENDIAPIAEITLEAEVAPRSVPGITAAITFQNGAKWSGAAGFADSSNSRRMVASDQMRIGSQTKTYTGTVILQMVQEGKLSLDDTLAHWLPDSGVPQADKITIRNLLDMTSGIPDYLTAPAAALSGPCPVSTNWISVLDQWVNQFGQMDATGRSLVNATSCPQLRRKPLGTMAYSNTNFVILGEIAEKIACGDTPKPGCYIRELQKRVLDRVPGLKGTTFPTSDNFPHPPFSGGYARTVNGHVAGMASLLNPDANEYADFTHITPPVPWTAGAMISSAVDEAIWADQLAANRFNLLTPEMQNKRITEVVQGEVAGVPARYGLAIYYMRSMLDDAEMLGHSGSIVGYTSNVFRRTDNNTDYAANVATFSIADQFSAPTLVWILDRNVWGAINAHGNCGMDATTPATCSGDSVRLKPLAVDGKLTLQSSGKSYQTYVPTGASPPIVTAKQPVPTVAFYGHGQSAVELGASAALTIEPEAALAMVGNQSAAIAAKGNGGKVEISGDVTAAGLDVAGLRDTGSGTVMTIDGKVSSSIVWWNPDLTLAGTPSVDRVAVPGDTSSAVDLGGANGKLEINGLVRTQRIKTAAVTARETSKGYHIDVGPQGSVIGPIELKGTKTALSIAHDGTGLYVIESSGLIPSPAVSAKVTPGNLSLLLRNAPLAAPRNEIVPLAVPGLPPISRSAPGLEAPRAASRFRGAAAVQSQPPAMLRLYGGSNNVTIAGALVGAIPSDYQSDYTMDVVAIDEKGSDNTLTVTSTGTVIGNIILGGANTRVRIDGTVKNDVIITGASITLEGNGRIEGKLTIEGQAVTEHGSLKIGPS